MTEPFPAGMYFVHTTTLPTTLLGVLDTTNVFLPVDEMEHLDMTWRPFRLAKGRVPKDLGLQTNVEIEFVDPDVQNKVYQFNALSETAVEVLKGEGSNQQLNLVGGYMLAATMPVSAVIGLRTKVWLPVDEDQVKAGQVDHTWTRYLLLETLNLKRADDVDAVVVKFTDGSEKTYDAAEQVEVFMFAWPTGRYF